MGKSCNSFRSFVKGLWLAFSLALSFNICLCNTECQSKDTHLKCFSKDLLLIADECHSDSSDSSQPACKSIFLRGDEFPWSDEWVSAKLVGAWYKVKFHKAFKMTKVIIQQRSELNSQIKEIDIEFDAGPKVQMILTLNVDASEIFDEKRFVSRLSSTVKFTVQSMHTDAGRHFLPGFKSVQIYDETCDRDYQELNMEHHSLPTDTSVVRSWSPFIGFLKMYLSFHEKLTLYLASSPSVKATVVYQFVIDTQRKELGVYKVTSKERVEMMNKTFLTEFNGKKRLFWINRNEMHWIIGTSGTPEAIADSSKRQVRYWGISCSSLEPVKLTFWKHIEKCYEKADYYWLADKLIGGTRIAELRQGKDGRISFFNNVQALPFGPLVDGHTSSSLHLTGKSYSRLKLAKFHEGCFSDMTSCTSGFTMAFWLSTLNSADINQDMIRLSGNGFSLRYKDTRYEAVVKTKTKRYAVFLYVGRAHWNHVFIFWDPVNGIKAIVNNLIEVNGTEAPSSGFQLSDFTVLDVGRKVERPKTCARMAFRDLALWERRISLDEAHGYYHCNNFEIPREFVTNRRSPSAQTGTFPFPEQNVASSKHGGSCTSDGSIYFPCSGAIDGMYQTQAYAWKPYMTIVLKFSRVYVVNKVVFRNPGTERNLTITFPDGTSEKVVEHISGSNIVTGSSDNPGRTILSFHLHRFLLADPSYQEMRFKDKTTNSITIFVEKASGRVRVAEIGVYYDFYKDRLLSSYINWAYGSKVKKHGTIQLLPFLTDGSTSDDSVTAITTAVTAEGSSSGSGSGSSSGLPLATESGSSLSYTSTSSHWLRIELSSGGETVKINLIRLFLVYDRTKYDDLKEFRVVFSDGSHVEFQLKQPPSSTEKTYWREFVFTPVHTNQTDLYFLATHGLSNHRIGMREVEIFYDASKDLPASKTIIDENSVRTWQERLSSANFGPFDFLLNIDVITTQNKAFLGRRTDQNSYRTLMRTTATGNLYVRIEMYQLASYSSVVNDGWHNIKLFYNAGESRLSLFIDNRLESTLIALISDESDGGQWETGVAVDSQFTGSLKNFRIHQAVRSFGVASKKIPDSALVASSALNSTSGANMARLNGPGAWIIAAKDNDKNQYLQVDLAISSRVMYIAFQGSGNMWVTWARIAFSTDGDEWEFLLDINDKPQLFRASHDADTAAMVMLYKPVVARYIRIYPYLANVGMALRTEIYDHDYGLPFNSCLRKHVPSYKGCVEREELFKLTTFLPLLFKSLASTPDGCISACALQGYQLAGLFQGAVCYCTEKTKYFTILSDAYCSFPCPGNPVLRCGGEATVSLYDTPLDVYDTPLYTNCSVEMNSKPLLQMFTKSEIFVTSSGDAVSNIDVSFNGVHIASVNTGNLQHRFLDYGKLHLIAEAKDSKGRQVAMTTTQITVQHIVMLAYLHCPKWVDKGETYECSLYVQRGTATELNCTINGEYLPFQIDDNMLVKSGDIIPEYPAPVVNDVNDSTIMLPGQIMLLSGVVVAFEFVTTGPGSLTIKLLRPVCDEGMDYCQTKFICIMSKGYGKNCPQSNPPTTANTFPSTAKVCDTLDAYCPTRKLPLNLTATYEVRFEETFEFSEAGVHTVIPPGTALVTKAGHLIAYSSATNLQHKPSGVSFRAESSTPGIYTSVERIEGRTALLRAHVWKYRMLYFNMNKTGELKCSLGNELAPNSEAPSAYIGIQEKVKDVILTFSNVSATNESVSFIVPPHPGGNVNYTFRFAQNQSIIIGNQNSSHTLIFNYTFTESGYYQVNLTVTNVRSSVDVFSGIRIMDAIKDLAFPCPFFAALDEVINVVLNAESGEDVTIAVQFGDGATSTVGPLDFAPGTGHSVPHTYQVVGSYNASFVAENAVSSVSITGLVVVMETVCNVTVTTAAKIVFAHVPVVLSASVAKGTDVQYLVIFSYSGSGLALPEMPFTKDKLSVTFNVACRYDFKVFAFNNVSANIYNGSLVVEDPTIANLSATVGLTIAGEPTVLAAERDSGAVFNCTWDFGDGVKETLPFDTSVQHVYPTGGKYLVNLNCSNSVQSANTSLEVKVLVYINQLDISLVAPIDSLPLNPLPAEDPLVFQFTTNAQFVNFTVNFGDHSPVIVTEETSIKHLFPAKFSTYDVNVNVSNAISHKAANISITLLQSVKDIALETNGPVKFGEELIFTVTMGQQGTYPCYYFNLGDGHELVYKGYYMATCPEEYSHVTDIRFISSTDQISFAHNYTNVTVYDVSCVGWNPVSSESAKIQAVIVEAPCKSPIVSVEGLAQSVEDAREFMRSEEFELITKNSIDCDASSETNFVWKIFKVASEGFSEDESVEVQLSDIKTDDWKIVFNPRCLEYGLYYISFTLTMTEVEGVSSTTFGYVKIIPSPIVAEIRGGSTRVLGFDKLVLLDGGMSRDPDVEEGNYEDMYFYWHCKRSDDSYTFPFEPEAIKPAMVANTTNSSQFLDYGGCFGEGPGRLNYSESMLAINIDTGLMRENASYALQLLVKKDVRRSVFNLDMQIIPGNPPTIALTCLLNCLEKFNPTVKVSLEATCQDCRNMDNMNYRWEVYLDSEGSWIMLQDIDDVILTRPSSPNLVIKEESLLGNLTYKIRVLVWRPGGIPGVAEFIRTVNIPPFGGWCFANPKTGYALDTLFGVTCGDWIDDNLPLKYTFSYFPGEGTLESLIYVGENSFSPNTTFPTGQEKNNTLYFVILVTDSLEASTLVELKVQVKPADAEALKSKVTDITSSNGTLGTLISSGDTQNAFQMISAVGNMLNFESEKNAMSVSPDANGTDAAQNATTETNTQDKQQQAKEQNTKLRTSLVNVISTAQVNTLEDAQRTSSVLGTVTKETDEVSAEAQDTATSTLETVGEVLENAAEKPGTNPRTVAKTAEAVLSGLGNVIQAAFYVEETAVSQQPEMDEDESDNTNRSRTAETTATEAPSMSTNGENEEILQEKQRKKELANKLMSVVKTVAKAVTTSKAPGEQPTRIDTPHLSLEVYRENPDDLSMKMLTAGSGSFALPEMGTILNGSGVVDVATVATPTNPFEDEANRIHSAVMTTEIRNASGGIGISNLDDLIDIRLPRDPIPVFSHRLYKTIAGKMIFHKFQVTHNDSSINIDLHLVGNCSERANFTLFLQKDQKPSVQKHMFNATIPDPQVLVWKNVSKSPNTFFLSNFDLKRDAKGTFYLGIMYNRPDIECPEFMNYTVNFFTSGCLYFDEQRNIWKGDGCTVGFLTNANKTQCLCNHLTSFGGDFVVPPNSIDWSAVSGGFANLDENPVVFAVVVSIIGIYFILLLWIRRLDKKDLKEFVTISLPDNDPRDNYNYEVVVYTGHPKYAGTTAKVFIVISGSLHDTEPRALLDSTDSALKAGGVDTFTLSVPSSLGKLDHIRVWHDDSGDSPSWYLNRILIRDVQTDKKTWFLCDHWLAVEEEDGLIERVLPAATKDDLVSFNFLFSIEARRKLFEEHLWFSVLSRRPRSQFTRAQRLSCCLSVLLSTMLANAMFYQTDDSSSSGNQVQAGPLVFSLKQLWIGFVSCLVVLPVNLFIMYIFRNVRPREAQNDENKNSDNADKYVVSEENDSDVLSDPTEKLFSCSKTSLPRRFIYVAYILLFLTISVSATFTIFYGFTFGKEKSERWISSTLLSFVQDLMLLQPLKVFAAATFIALIIKDPNKLDEGDKSDNKPEVVEQVDGEQTEDEEQQIAGDDNFQRPTTPRSVVKPPAQADLVAVRELRTKQKLMRRIISEVCWYVAYLVLISIVAYGNRDPKAYFVTKTMNDMFVENKYVARMRLDDISTIPKYWSWLYNSILPAMEPPYWYGPYGLDDIEALSKTMASKSRARAKSKTSKTKSIGSGGSDDLDAVYHRYPKRYIADRAVSYVVGLARARQLRNAPQDSCIVHPTVRHLHHRCSEDYSWSNEDEGCYNISWSRYNGSKLSCEQMKGGKSPWKYHSTWDLKGTPFWGNFHNYWGGGYVWNLDSSLAVVQKESKILEEQSWIDHQTRAIFFEFTIYNAFTNFFCSVTLLLEKQITGGIYPYGQLHSLRLYHYVGAEAFVTLICEIIFVGVLCYIFMRELKEARSNGIKKYFRDPWNYFDILGLVFSFTAIGLYFARMAATSLALKRINENHNTFVSFHYVSAIDQSFTIFLGLAIFVYFLKVLRLLRFNRKISMLSTTLIACTDTLLGFMLTYMLLFAAYAQIMYLVYGRDMPEFATYQRCLSSLMEMTLGSSDFDGMNATQRIITGFIFFSYTMLNMCVYMNLFISILSETFSEVRADVLLQANDHEIVDFMVKSLKKTFFSSTVEPITNPVYKEPKDDIDLGVEKISETSECIQGALRELCREDIRQTLWFGDKSKQREKRILLDILCDSGEILTENDIGNAVPLFDGVLKKLSLENLLVIRNNQIRKIASDLAKSIRSTRRGTRLSSRVIADESEDGSDIEVDGSWDDSERLVSNSRNYIDCDGGDNDGDRDVEKGYDSDGKYSDGNCEDGNGENEYNNNGCSGDDGDGNFRGGYESEGRYSDRDCDDDNGNSDSVNGDNDADDSDGNNDGSDSDRDCENNDGNRSDIGDVGNSDGQQNGGPDSDDENNYCGHQSDDGAHSEIDTEDNPTDSQPNQSITIDLHDSDEHDKSGNAERSPRSDACVISMATKKER